MLTLLTWNETLYFLIDFWALYCRPYCKVGSFFRFFHLLPFAGNRRTTILPTTSVTWSLYYKAHWLRWSQNFLTDLLKFKYRRLETTRMGNDGLKDDQCLVRYFLSALRQSSNILLHTSCLQSDDGLSPSKPPLGCTTAVCSTSCLWLRTE